MPLQVTKGCRQLVTEAEKGIETVGVADALELHGPGDAVFGDLRDVRQPWRGGLIPDAFHCPRGMPEFWIDPACAYFKDILACGRKFIFCCNLGWRSALAAQIAQTMGPAPAAHLGGGFDAWKQAGGPVAYRDPKR